jgi:hypothetical protein
VVGETANKKTQTACAACVFLFYRVRADYGVAGFVVAPGATFFRAAKRMISSSEAISDPEILRCAQDDGLATDCR